jgi:hypothetical protein
MEQESSDRCFSMEPHPIKDAREPSTVLKTEEKEARTEPGSKPKAASISLLVSGSKGTSLVGRKAAL